MAGTKKGNQSPEVINIFDFNSAPRQEDARKDQERTEDPIASFRAALARAGLGAPDEIIPDGVLHRFPTPEDKKGEKTGWYVLYSDSVPSGAAGDWRHNIEISWSAKTELSLEEMTRQNARIEESKKLREQERQRVRAETAQKAQRIWDNAQEAMPNHPYLVKKNIKPHGIKQDKHGNLLVPAYDLQGRIHTLQLIDPEGTKRFLTGGAVRGHFFVISGKGDRIYLAEGYATGATIHEATGSQVLVSFHSGNLGPVAQQWKEKAQEEGSLFVCSDNDWKKDGNPGVTAAHETGLRVIIPEGLTEGSDFNDLQQERGMDEVKRQLGVGSKYRINIHEWTIDQYSGPAPEREWLVANTIPMGDVTVLSAKGDTGKGMLMLDLALKVGTRRPHGVLDPLMAFGNVVQQNGVAVIFTAEDNRAEVHRRLEQIGYQCNEKVHIIPLPNTGGPAPIVQPGKTGPEASSFYFELKQQLIKISNLKLVNFDPLASFVMADINADPAVGAFTMGLLASIGTETGAAVIVCHHLAKTRHNIKGHEDARNLVRGSTAIVDNSRASYVMWTVEPKRSQKICHALGRRWAPNMVCQGCIVKANGPADREIKTFVRNPQSGLLEIHDDSIREVLGSQKEQLLNLLEHDISDAAEEGFPFTQRGTSESSLYTRRNELTGPLSECGRDKLQSLCQELLDVGRVKKCRARGSKQAQWLDVPGGTFYRGEGEFPIGARVGE